MFPCEFCEIFKNTFSYRTPVDGCIWLKLYHQIKNQTFNVKFVIKFVHSVFWHFSHNIRTKYGERCETQEVKTPLREKYPNTEFFLARIFPHSNWIQTDTEYSPYSVRIQENTDQKMYFHFLSFTSALNYILSSWTYLIVNAQYKQIKTFMSVVLFFIIK